MKYLILISALLIGPLVFASADDLFKTMRSRQIEMVPDTTEKRIKSVLLFLSSGKNLKMESSLIETMGPNVTYYVVKDSNMDPNALLSLIAPEVLKQVRIKFIDYNQCFTPWTQDYLLRLYSKKEKKPILAPTYSTNLIMNDCKPFELGIADLLEKSSKNMSVLEQVNPSDFQSSPNYFSIKRLDRRNGDFYGNSASYKSLPAVKIFKYFYGEGGMRVPTRSYLFMERTEVSNLVQYTKGQFKYQDTEFVLSELEALYQKQIISVGESLPVGEFYIYHIDFFLTPVERAGKKTVIFMGHPKKTREILGSTLQSMPYYDQSLWNEKEQQADLIENELRGKGFLVKRLPIVFLRKKGEVQSITFNNGLQSKDENGNSAFYIPDYDLPDLNSYLEPLRKDVENILYQHEIKAYFVKGGENFIDQNGQLRCSAGVLSYFD